MKATEITPMCTIIFWVLAALLTTFYTFWAYKIHNGQTYHKYYKLDGKKIEARLIGQRWFNFLGSIAGWLILWILLPCLTHSFSTQSTDCLSSKDIILFLLSLIGISGYLPLALFGIARSANELANKIGKP
jgi:hypothetical protein